MIVGTTDSHAPVACALVAVRFCCRDMEGRRPANVSGFAERLDSLAAVRIWLI